MWRGLPSISWEFLTGSPENLGRDGGILPTIIGTIVLGLVALLIATPLGIGSAIYLTEYTYENRFTRALRFGTESLAGVPSIIFGLFGFIFFVTYLQMGWSILAGGLTLALMVLPTIIRTSEEAIRTVPRSYRDVSYSLGASRWKMVTTAVSAERAAWDHHRRDPVVWPRGQRDGGGDIHGRHGAKSCQPRSSRLFAPWQCISTFWRSRVYRWRRPTPPVPY